MVQHELGTPESTSLQFGYLAGKEGLLTGEKFDQIVRPETMTKPAVDG